MLTHRAGYRVVLAENNLSAVPNRPRAPTFSAVTGFRLFFWWVLLLAGVAWELPVFGQAPLPAEQARIVVSAGLVPVDQPMEVTVELTGISLQRIGAFPNLAGFKKTTRARQTTTRIVAHGTRQDTVVILRVIQRYLAFGEGEKALPAFTISVNGQPVVYPGGTVRIGPATTVAPPAGDEEPDQSIGYGLTDELFGKPKLQDYRDVPDQARLYLSASPEGAAWAGEGVRARLYLTIAPEDQAVLNFANDFARQIEELRRAVKPPDVWEEMPPDYPLVPDTVAGPGGQSRLRFLLHDAVYYPLTASRPLRFPAVSLRLVKYRLAKKPVEGAENRLATDRIVVTEPVEIPVRPLPPHPLRDVVPVGSFQLREFLSHDPARVNQPTRYWVEITGPGNLTPVRFPEPLTTGNTGIAAYRPRVALVPAWPPVGFGIGGGRKRFEWELVADHAGTYRLDSLISLIYFDPRTARYDTLRSGVRWHVRGKARPVPTDDNAPPWAGDPFYDRINREPLTMAPAPDPAELRRYANGALAVLGAVGLWLLVQGRRQRG